jgi:hypothetical protein
LYACDASKFQSRKNQTKLKVNVTISKLTTPVFIKTKIHDKVNAQFNSARNEEIYIKQVRKRRRNQKLQSTSESLPVSQTPIQSL